MPRARPLLVLLPLLLTDCARGSAADPSGSAPPTVAVTPSASSSASSACSPAATPDTGAGRRLAELLAATNAPSRAAAEAFVTTAMTDEARARLGDFVVGNAGDALTLELCRVESSGARELAAIVGGANGAGQIEYAVIVLAVDDHVRVTSLGVRPVVKDDLETPSASLDAEDIGRIVEGVANSVADYVFADKAVAMAARLRDARAAGEYAEITSGHVLAHRLAEDLFAVTRDKHLDVIYQATPPEPPRPPTPEELARLEQRAQHDNHGMPIAELREGNIGYLKVIGFLPSELAADAISTTMSSLADADALVIDLRENGGGSPDGVAFMTSYLFGETRVHLNDLYSRRLDHTESFFTSPDAPGRRFGPDKPVYVLTSARTFSAAEEFAYNLQAQQRATIVGEVTGGGAHPIEPILIADHWTLLLPTSRAINPITKTNWEGVGVQPDIAVPADRALDEALARARASR